VDSLQYTVYDSADEQHYDWHQDIGPDHNHRKISFVLLLSDPAAYEGGNFEIGQAGGGPRSHTVGPLKTKGSALAFPSFLSHRVSPVTKGVRRSLVGWIAGPKLK
jgi:PKHD-type hydroxylase